jgi:hypothetical protein
VVAITLVLIPILPALPLSALPTTLIALLFTARRGVWTVWLIALLLIRTVVILPTTLLVLLVGIVLLLSHSFPPWACLAPRKWQWQCMCRLERVG